MEELKLLWLENNRKRYPNFPDSYRVIPKYTDKTANGLTKCIIDFLTFSGHQAERVNCTGGVIDERKTYTNVLGQHRTIGSIRRIKTSGTRGTADIHAIVFGLSVKIEVKIGKDRQSEVQKEYQRNIENAGGHYWIAKDFKGFMDKYNEIKNGYNKHQQSKVF